MSNITSINNGWNNKVPKFPNPPNPIFHAQELLGILLLNLPIHVMKKHVRHTRSLSPTRHHRGGVYDRHSTGRGRKIPSRPIDHDHIPITIVHLIRQIVQCQLTQAVTLEWVTGGHADTGTIILIRGEEGLGLGEARGVTNGVGT